MRHHDRRAKFRCSTCLMVGRTEAGVRLHINMKHKAKGGEVMPINGPAIADEGIHRPGPIARGWLTGVISYQPDHGRRVGSMNQAGLRAEGGGVVDYVEGDISQGGRSRGGQRGGERGPEGPPQVPPDRNNHR
jgi:hypothetical protein